MPALARSSIAPFAASSGPIGAWWPGRERLAPNFRLNRRCEDRWSLRGVATLLSLGVDLGILIELDQLDCAPWWLAGNSITPIAVGTRVSIGFSNPGCRSSLAIVMRCQRTAAGFGSDRYRVAVRFVSDSLV
jgi:hypothetical protein